MGSIIKSNIAKESMIFTSLGLTYTPIGKAIEDEISSHQAETGK